MQEDMKNRNKKTPNKMNRTENLGRLNEKLIIGFTNWVTSAEDRLSELEDELPNTSIQYKWLEKNININKKKVEKYSK